MTITMIFRSENWVEGWYMCNSCWDISYYDEPHSCYSCCGSRDYLSLCDFLVCDDVPDNPNYRQLTLNLDHAIQQTKSPKMPQVQ